MQVVAEAALAGVLSFARSHKFFQRLLFPTFCVVDDVQEAVEKMAYLDRHPDRGTPEVNTTQLGFRLDSQLQTCGLPSLLAVSSGLEIGSDAKQKK